MIIISIPGHRARNFTNRTTAWMWLRRMRPTWASGTTLRTPDFMELLDESQVFRVFTKAGEALITQEQTS